MKRQTLEARLHHAERRVTLAESDVFEQVKIISQLERLGQGAKHARAWLVKLEQILVERIDHRDRLKHDLSSHEKDERQATSLARAA